MSVWISDKIGSGKSRRGGWGDEVTARVIVGKRNINDPILFTSLCFISTRHAVISAFAWSVIDC